MGRARRHDHMHAVVTVLQIDRREKMGKDVAIAFDPVWELPLAFHLMNIIMR